MLRAATFLLLSKRDVGSGVPGLLVQQLSWRLFTTFFFETYSEETFSWRE